MHVGYLYGMDRHHTITCMHGLHARNSIMLYTNVIICLPLEYVVDIRQFFIELLLPGITLM